MRSSSENGNRGDCSTAAPETFQALSHSAYHYLTTTPTVLQGCFDLRDGQGREVATVRGTLLRKTVHGSKHQLRYPPAWALDVCLLNQARELGATQVMVRDVETGTEYHAPLENLDRFGIAINRGHGNQVALPMEHWTIVAEEQEPELPPTCPAQLGMFGGAI